MKTRKGIELELKKSDYKTSFLNHTFYFSSPLYLKKFMNLVNSYIEVETIKIYNKYKIPLKFDLYLAFSFYKKIETRGFYIVDDITGKEIKSNKEFTAYKL